MSAFFFLSQKQTEISEHRATYEVSSYINRAIFYNFINHNFSQKFNICFSP